MKLPKEIYKIIFSYSENRYNIMLSCKLFNEIGYEIYTVSNSGFNKMCIDGNIFAINKLLEKYNVNTTKDIISLMITMRYEIPERLIKSFDISLIAKISIITGNIATFRQIKNYLTNELDFAIFEVNFIFSNNSSENIIEYLDILSTILDKDDLYHLIFMKACRKLNYKIVEKILSINRISEVFFIKDISKDYTEIINVIIRYKDKLEFKPYELLLWSIVRRKDDSIMNLIDNFFEELSLYFSGSDKYMNLMRQLTSVNRNLMKFFPYELCKNIDRDELNNMSFLFAINNNDLERMVCMKNFIKDTAFIASIALKKGNMEIFKQLWPRLHRNGRIILSGRMILSNIENPFNVEDEYIDQLKLLRDDKFQFTNKSTTIIHMYGDKEYILKYLLHNNRDETLFGFLNLDQRSLEYLIPYGLKISNYRIVRELINKYPIKNDNYTIFRYINKLIESNNQDILKHLLNLIIK